jgi:hypothetical protein
MFILLRVTLEQFDSRWRHRNDQWYRGLELVGGKYYSIMKLSMDRVATAFSGIVDIDFAARCGPSK